jgi:hypothetical protein
MSDSTNKAARERSQALVDAVWKHPTDVMSRLH